MSYAYFDIYSPVYFFMRHLLPYFQVWHILCSKHTHDFKAKLQYHCNPIPCNENRIYLCLRSQITKLVFIKQSSSCNWKPVIKQDFSAWFLFHLIGSYRIVVDKKMWFYFYLKHQSVVVFLPTYFDVQLSDCSKVSREL